MSLFLSSCNPKQLQNSKEASLVKPEVIQPSEDIVFVLDVSASMIAKDFEPNRLEAVKGMLKKMIQEKEPQQQMSIVLFAGEAMILCPLTTDSTQLLEKIKPIEVDKLANGTAIGMGIMFGLYELSESNSPKKDIIVLTDGINNNETYSPILAAQIANQKKVKIHSFGVGCNGKALTPVAKRFDGSFVFANTTVEIDEEFLRLVGGKTNGNYLRVTCNSDLDNLQGLKTLLADSDAVSPVLDTIPSQKIDSIWGKIRLTNQTALDQFYAPTKKDTSDTSK